MVGAAMSGALLAGRARHGGSTCGDCRGNIEGEMVMEGTKELDRWGQVVYGCHNEWGKTVYESKRRLFTVFDSRGNIITRLDYDIAVTLGEILKVVEVESCEGLRGREDNG